MKVKDLIASLRNQDPDAVCMIHVPNYSRYEPDGNYEPITRWTVGEGQFSNEIYLQADELLDEEIAAFEEAINTVRKTV